MVVALVDDGGLSVSPSALWAASVGVVVSAVVAFVAGGGHQIDVVFDVCVSDAPCVCEDCHWVGAVVGVCVGVGVDCFHVFVVGEWPIRFEKVAPVAGECEVVWSVVAFDVVDVVDVDCLSVAAFPRHRSPVAEGAVLFLTVDCVVGDPSVVWHPSFALEWVCGVFDLLVPAFVDCVDGSVR